ncbi:type II toxin-antitoxin system HicA family toxin [Candidatus Bathyarchaeota archaeon]|nr:type II toxin-antitoxin system HicA family toxin [Candidatus Bathyarchaeota archaeon]
MALPLVSGRRVIKALTKAGFLVAGKKGSHVRLKKKVDDRVFVVIVPDHAELARGTLKSILRQANMTREEFLRILEEV